MGDKENPPSMAEAEEQFRQLQDLYKPQLCIGEYLAPATLKDLLMCELRFWALIFAWYGGMGLFTWYFFRDNQAACAITAAIAGSFGGIAFLEHYFQT